MSLNERILLAWLAALTIGVLTLFFMEGQNQAVIRSIMNVMITMTKTDGRLLELIEIAHGLDG